ncbi:hypothetical protein J2W49_002795 [Hydrogenophaga palleronii]|uniref:Uncharacterized protein n=1 Tax=Hydrogenophaga palleronii TaxID=65655 RepID=A0ABU1WP65_9BURK|nr:hypothetical protein [Hydrogenophaga palleronii]MDR7150832.1 hypothetical protein [Hydrogenophaga palleronii]
MTRFALSILTILWLVIGVARADDLHYEGIWVDGEATSLHTAPLSLQSFQKTGQELAESGLVLIDLETGIRNGQRLYAGLWTRGTGSTIFEGPMGPIPFREAMTRRSAQGLRLVDFEIFRIANGGRRYVGVWRPGSGEQILTGPMEQDAFLARGTRLTNDGLRLVDVEVERVGGRLLYSGLFRTGAGSNILTTPMPLAQFRASLAQRHNEGLELVDMERIDAGRSVVGVFRSGNALAEITSPRRFAAQFALAQSQFNNRKRAISFEFVSVATPTPGSGGADPHHPPPMPDNPAHVDFTDGQILRLEFQEQINEVPFRLTLPSFALPDWLPRTEDGTPILPDDACGLLVRKADSIFWQVPGNPQVTTPPFNAIEDVSDLGSEFHLGGVHFAGPMLGCADTQKPWVFPFPFTTQGPFEPLPNMSLAIQLEQNSEIDFIKDTGPSPKPVDVDKLFKDNSAKKLKDMVKFWDALFKEGKDIEKYCPTVGNFWKKLCSQFPDSDEVCSEEVAALPDC